MNNYDNIKSINDLKRDVLEQFIAELPKEDKQNLQKFLKEHPQKNASGIFTVVRAYIFHTYFRKTPMNEKKTTTFADTLMELLKDENDNNSDEI